MSLGYIEGIRRRMEKEENFSMFLDRESVKKNILVSSP